MVNVILGHQGWRAVAVGLVVARVVALKREDEHVAAVDDGSDGLVVRQAADLIVSAAEASGGKCTSVLMFWAVALEVVSVAVPALEAGNWDWAVATLMVVAAAVPAFAPDKWVWAVANDMAADAAVPAIEPGTCVWAVAIHMVGAAASPAIELESGVHDCSELNTKATASGSMQRTETKSYGMQ